MQWNRQLHFCRLNTHSCHVHVVFFIFIVLLLCFVFIITATSLAIEIAATQYSIESQRCWCYKGAQQVNWKTNVNSFCSCVNIASMSLAPLRIILVSVAWSARLLRKPCLDYLQLLQDVLATVLCSVAQMGESTFLRSILGSVATQLSTNSIVLGKWAATFSLGENGMLPLQASKERVTWRWLFWLSHRAQLLLCFFNAFSQATVNLNLFA